MPAHQPSSKPVTVVGAIKGRGTAWQIAHRFESVERVTDDDGWGSLDAAASSDQLPAGTQVTEESVHEALAKNDSPDLPFTWSLNPYRGCEHGCIYCYARPTHSYLNLSPGLDFETRLIAKVNIAERLRAALARPTYRPSAINVGSATDAYQPIERRLQLTRQVLSVLDECRHPYSVVTKSAGIVRDIDLLASAAARQQCQVFVSITTLDSDLARRLEPRAAAPHRRLEAIQRLHDAGVPVSVNVAPIIPFLNEPEIEHIVEAAAKVGARSVHYTVVRLPWEVAPLFKDWLQVHVPERAVRILARIRDLHGVADRPDEDAVYQAHFGQRMKGQGPWADMIRQRVRAAAVRCGLSTHGLDLSLEGFRPPAMVGQGQLF